MLFKLALCPVLCALPGREASVRADEPRTADEVVARYLTVIGGREKLAARTSMRLTGKIAMPQDMEARFVLEYKWPNKFRTEMVMPPSATFVHAYDGRIAWQVSPLLGEPAELPPKLAGLYAEQADIDGPLVDYKKKGHRLELVGREEVDGGPAYKLKLTRKGAAAGDVEFHFLDAKSFLPVKVHTKRTVAGEVVEQVRMLSRYKAVDGLLVAHSIREKEGSAEEWAYVRTIEKVEINVDLPDERFSLAAAKKAATAKKAAAGPRPVPVIKNDPAARSLYDEMFAAMRAAKTLSFDSQYRLDMGGLPGGRVRYKAWLKKPNHFRMEGFGPGDKAGGKPGGILIGDGEAIWLYWPKGRPMFSSEERTDHEKTKTDVYMTHATPQGGHSIGHEASKLGVGILMTILDLSTFHGYTDSLQPYVDAVAGRGTETVGDEPCDVIEVSIMEGQRTWKIWLSRRDHLPRKLAETVRVHIDLVAEEVWTNVSVNGDIPDALFAWTPPDGWKEWRMPKTETLLLEPGTAAPDFELKLADGKTCKLSNYRGKAVLLVFWRVG